MEITIFWVFQILATFCWVASAMTSLYSPLSLLLAMSMSGLQILNLYGYQRCFNQMLRI